MAWSARRKNEASLQSLSELGADAVIDLKQSGTAISEAFRKEAGEAGIQVILDFLWGHPTELLLETLVPRELSFAKQRVRLVPIGEMAGKLQAEIEQAPLKDVERAWKREDVHGKRIVIMP